MLPGSKVNNLGWHQDSSYFPYTNQPNTSLVTWTSFSYKNKIDGNIELIPSSHLRGKINHKKNIFDKRKKVKLDKRGMYYLEKKKLNGFPKPVSSDTCSGETVFFDTNIVHRTSEAPKKNIRYTIITRHKVI
jgi:ectoine hydroxylase-related dioxygenase (phytanoyl-CoA dioxygenase family)